MQTQEQTSAEAPFVPNNHAAHKTTLGALAVGLEEYRVDNAIRMDRYDPHAPVQTYENKEVGLGFSVQLQLDNVRKVLGRLDANQRSVLDSYMQENAPSFLKATKNAKPGLPAKLASVPNPVYRQDRSHEREPWANWLQSGANDQELLNVLQWHVDSLDKQQQSPEIQEKLEAARLAYKQNIEAAVLDGWLSEAALDALPEVDGLGVYFGDIFDTTFDDKLGYWSPGTKYIVIEQGKDGDLSHTGGASHSIDDNFAHEANHALLSTVADEEDEKSLTEPFDQVASRWLREALTEHIAQVFAHGDAELLEPSKRHKDQKVYEPERLLLQTVLTGGSRGIDVALATRAYSGAEEDIQKFIDAVDESWGTKGVLAAVAEFVAIEEDTLVSSGEPERDAQVEAVTLAREHLHKNPQEIFGGSYALKSGVLVQAARASHKRQL